MLYLDLRCCADGGECAAEASVWDDNLLLDASTWAARTQGRDLVLVTHGFNVNRSGGKLALARWRSLMELPDSCLCVGVLWPGDARFLHVVDYPFEGDVAIGAGKLLARFVDAHARAAASVSLVSHSLGARVVLQALSDMQGGVRCLIIMAGAIEDDCLSNEYRLAAGKAKAIHVLASNEDWVLAGAFPIGNVLGEILMHGHPYHKRALGRDGPSDLAELTPRPGVWELPDGWSYGHLDYLPVSADGPLLHGAIAAPSADAAPPVAGGGAPWKASWSAWLVAGLLQ